MESNQPEKSENSVDMSEDELARRLVTDTSSIPNAVSLRGYLGKSSKEGYMRLYSTPDLNDFLDIEEKDILHRQKMDADKSILRGSIVWVRASAELARTKITSEQIRAEFLSSSFAGIRRNSAATKVANQAKQRVARFNRILAGGGLIGGDRSIVIASNLICNSDICIPNPKSDWCLPPDSDYCLPDNHTDFPIC